MSRPRSVFDWMKERGFDERALVKRSGLDRAIVQAIIACRYTPSPEQRQLIAEALELTVEQIAWCYVTEVAHLYGHGTQFGRSP